MMPQQYAVPPGYGAPQPLPPGKDSTKVSYPKSEVEPRWLFDYEPEFIRMKTALQGGYLTWKDGKLTQVIPEGSVPYMNTEGIEATMALYTGMITKIDATTSYEDEARVLELCEDDAHVFVNFFTVNMQRFELEPEKASVVLNMLMDSIEANRRKSIGAQGLKLMLTSEEQRTIVTESGKSGLRRLLPI